MIDGWGMILLVMILIFQIFGFFVEVMVDLGVIEYNVWVLCEYVGYVQLMVVVKVDGYGYGVMCVV